MTALRLFQTASAVTTLGPYTRFGIWVQGCEKRCSGCVSPEARALDGGYLRSAKELADEIVLAPDIEGITISGGEPFLQAAAVCELINRIEKQRGLGVILYTGYVYDEIKDTELFGLCDTVIDGEYVQELDDGLSLRGSANQRLIHRTVRYMENIEFGRFGRRTELIRTKEGGISLVGVPSRHSADFAVRLRKVLV